MIHAKLSAFLSFGYNEAVISEIKKLSTRYYIALDKTWEIKEEDINLLQLMLPKEKFVLHDYEPELFQIPEGYTFKSIPMEHQIAAVTYMLNNPKCILGDEQGLGKTAESLYVAKLRKDLLKYKHTLVVCCVNKLKWNWKKEAEMHTSEKAYVLGTRYTKKNTLKPITMEFRNEDLDEFDKFKETYFLITNIESFRDDEFSRKIRKLCLERKIEMIIVDEIHKCNNHASKMGMNFLSIHAESEVALSGTILINNPLDLYFPLKWIGVESQNFWQFQRQYVKFKRFKKKYEDGTEKMLNIPIGYQNLGELQRKIGDFSLRRKKEEVLNLPSKICRTEFLEMSEKQATLYNEVRSDVLKEVNLIKACHNPLEKLTRLRQVTSDPCLVSSSKIIGCKEERLLEIIEEVVLNHKKAIVFSNWEKVTGKCFHLLKKYNPALITGSTKDAESEKEKFQKDDTCSVIIGTIGALGTGYTLTAATTVIFMDSPWTAADKVQAEDRAHRIGTKESVEVITFVCQGTVDERVEDIVNSKREINELIVETKFNGINPIDYLLS